MIQTHNQVKTYSSSVLDIIITALFPVLIIGAACYFAVVSTKLFSICFFLVLPSILTVIVDKSQGRLFSIVICICNLSGLVIYLPSALQMFYYYNVDGIISILMAPQQISVIYGLSIFGFLLCIILPRIFTVVYIQYAQSRREKLLNTMKKLGREWDIKDSTHPY